MNIFKKKKDRYIPKSRVDYPNGLYIVTESNQYLIKNKNRLKFYSTRVALSWNLHPVYTSEAAVAHLEVKGVLGYRDGTLIQNMSDGRIYLISDGKRLHVTNPDWLKMLGFDLEEDMIFASNAETNLHEDGGELN